MLYIYTIFNYYYQLLELTVQPSLGMTSQKVLRLRYAASKWPICSRFTTPRNVLRTPWLLWERLHLASRLAEKKRTCWMYQVARQSPSAPRVQDHIEESWGICKKIREILFSHLDLEGRCALSFQCLFRRISLAGPLACRKKTSYDRQELCRDIQKLWDNETISLEMDGRKYNILLQRNYAQKVRNSTCVYRHTIYIYLQ